MQENGYDYDLIYNLDYPDHFGYTDRFADICRMDNLEGIQSIAKLNKEASELAAEILKRDFPDIRTPNSSDPELKCGELMQYCDKDAFKALIKERTPWRFPLWPPKKQKVKPYNPFHYESTTRKLPRLVPDVKSRSRIPTDCSV